MNYSFEVPSGFLLKGLHFFPTTKGAEQWWAYVQTEKAEYANYRHFQGALGFSIEEAIANAHRNLVKSLAARKAPTQANALNIKIDLSSLKGTKL